MDILNGEELYEKYFEFKETDPVGSKWDFFGMGDSNFINNSGSYFILIIVIGLSYILIWFVNMICKKYAHN